MSIRSVLHPAICLILLLAAGCAERPARDDSAGEAREALSQLAQWLSGRFETAGRGADAERHMLATQFTLDESEPGHWIYVAQWRRGASGPERQFVYRLRAQGERLFTADLFALRDGLELPMDPGAARLSGLRPGDLVRREGCRVRLSQDGLSFVGGTRGSDCATDYRGADRLRIELTVREDEVREWLQGFDAAGRRLWSAGDGSRVYRRVAAD